MAISSRLLLLITFITLFILSISIYIYSKDYYQNGRYSNIQLTLPNGTKIVSNKKDDSLSSKTDRGEIKTNNPGFIQGFIASLFIILITELGDKTFFIAAIMAMRHARLTIYVGAMGALGTMTILSALFGVMITKFLPRIYTYYLSGILFACFGIKMLKDGYGMSPDEGTEEYEEVQNEIEKAEANEDVELGNGESIDNSSKGNQSQQRLPQKSMGVRIVAMIRRYISPIFIQAFIMTFLAEWGDRSQISTIVLAAGENLLGVIVGGIIGHGFCTGLAVLGGRFVAQCISPKTVTLVGGVVFLCFALSTFFFRPEI
ncbi:hypothetical protein I4U23_029581 [Adineta vaga]|nr:hypothetical protein I4U23_029581 [Adineta vaga]